MPFLLNAKMKVILSQSLGGLSNDGIYRVVEEVFLPELATRNVRSQSMMMVHRR
jgi:hypothetical protein